jgi:hypothetical protein
LVAYGELTPGSGKQKLGDLIRLYSSSLAKKHQEAGYGYIYMGNLEQA